MLFRFFVATILLVCVKPLDGTPAYAEWAHHHLVWKSSGHPQQVIVEMLKNYSAFNISVGAVNVDSAWSTGFNNFIFNTELFPDPKGLIDFVHGNGQRIVLWVTSMINTDSSNYAEAVANNYVFNKTLSWWHGEGRLVDFGNPEAVAWLEKQIDENLFSKYGCTDGWKVDGVDPYIIEIWNSSWTWRRYADDYYGFFLNYTRSRCGNTSLIMSRPCDCVPPGGIDHTGICPLHLPFAPRSAVFMGWVGDQDSTFLGLGVAYGNMMASASAGYISFGSDTGGYRGDGPQNVAKDLFLRWASLNAMMPVLETGGDNRHCPWEFDEDTVDRYRHLVNFHHSLVPYLYANGLKLAQEVTGSLVTPIPSGGHLLGPSAFAYPILTENATDVLITFPSSLSNGSRATGWYLYGTTQFFGANSTTVFNATELDALPFFIASSTTMVTYDTLHTSVPFPSPTTPVVVHVYLESGGSQHSFSTSDGEYLGISEISGQFDVASGAITVSHEKHTQERRTKLCVFHSSLSDAVCVVC